MEAGLSGYFDFLKAALSAPGQFSAKPYYNKDGDTLFFYARDVPTYAKRLNPTLTLILDANDDSLAGFKIKGIRRIVTRMQRLGMEKFTIDDQGIRLKIFIQFALVAPPEDPAMAGYEEALGQFEDVVIDEDELQMA